MSLSEKVVYTLQQKVLALIKQKDLLPKIITNNVLFHEGFLNVTPLFQEYLSQAFDLFLLMFNHWIEEVKLTVHLSINEFLLRNLVIEGINNLIYDHVKIFVNCEHSWESNILKMLIENN